MTRSRAAATSRRGFLTGGVTAGAGALLAACTGNTSSSSNNAAQTKAVSNNDKPGKHVTIGFSAPQADHGWIAAISKNAAAQAKQYSDVTFQPVAATNDVATQISSVKTLITKGVDAIVMLPFDGKALTQVGLQAMNAGIAVVNLDRVFDTPRAYRTWIGGNNYGMGLAAGQYIGNRLKQEGKSHPVIAEVAGIDNLPLTQDRSKGFRDALRSFGYSVTIRQAAQFTVESGQNVMSNILQAKPHIDAVWNHDDDQGIGVLAAIKQAHRSEFFMVGGAGSANMMRLIKADKSVVKCTVTYPPTMASSAISLARLIAQGKGMADLTEREVPAYIMLSSATVTKANVDKYLPLGFES
ncbi:MAG: substrate-binding domain-containing protein [Nocardiopsaceae bacterium]|jgi:ribose transport system substrate-binding protein|nr:substrate-binding domain-containing protein [Nocardiopsaceae bacterium]